MDEIKVCTSGYYNPIHLGHLQCLERSKELGDYLIVFVDSDEKAIRKNGYSFMPQNERAEIIKAIKYVDEVVLINIPVSEAIKIYAKDCKYFTKGGDRTLDNLPKDEIEVCKEFGIEIICGLGDKIQSSSELVRKAKKYEKGL